MRLNCLTSTASFSSTLDQDLCHLKVTEELFLRVIMWCVFAFVIPSYRAIGHFTRADDFHFGNGAGGGHEVICLFSKETVFVVQNVRK